MQVAAFEHIEHPSIKELHVSQFPLLRAYPLRQTVQVVGFEQLRQP